MLPFNLTQAYNKILPVIYQETSELLGIARCDIYIGTIEMLAKIAKDQSFKEGTTLKINVIKISKGIMLRNLCRDICSFGTPSVIS